jgi:hypothetical protein
MKSELLLLGLLLASSLFGQNQRQIVTLTSQDVDTNSVHHYSQGHPPAVEMRCLGKTSAQLKAFVEDQPHIKVMQNGVTVAEADCGCGAIVDQHTNYVRLVLLFSKLEQAKAAEKALQGKKE